MTTQDVRHTMRQLRRNPVFSLVTIAVIAAGVGATTAVFGLVHGVIMRPLPYGDADRLAVVWEDLVREGNHTFSVTPATYHDIAARTKSFVDVAAQQTGGGFTLRDEHSAEVIRAGFVTGNFFSVIRAQPALGRALTAGDEQAGARVVVLSNDLWRRRYGSDPSIVGRAITLNDAPYVVVGVMPASFDAPWVFKAAHLPAALWTPLTGVTASDRESAMLQVIARMRDGVTHDAAQADMSALANTLATEHPETNRDIGLNVVPMRDQIVGRVHTPLLLLLASVVLLLVIAAANLAALLLQRATMRRHELAIRTALGASRLRIVSQIVTENVVYALIGGVVGVWIGALGLRALLLIAPPDTPRTVGIHMDRTVLMFAALAMTFVALILAVAPALRASADIGNVLRAGRMKRREWTRISFTFIQVTLAVVLLVAGTLLSRSYERLSAVDPGFAVGDVLTVRVALPDVKYDNATKQAEAFDAVVRAVRVVPGVQSVGATSRLPLDPPFGYAQVNVKGAAAPADDRSLAGYRVVTPDYMATLRVPIRAGRGLLPSDRAGSERVAVVNAAFVSKYFPGRSPVGAAVSFGPASVDWIRIVGVAGDVVNGGPDAEPVPEVFIPFAQEPMSSASLVVRTQGTPAALARSIVRAIADLDPTIATQDARPMQDLLVGTVALPRFSAFLSITFAALALFLAVLGLSAVFAQAVASRRRELGIRAALGASAFRLTEPVLRPGLLIALAGIACGCSIAYVGSRVLQNHLFQIAPTDPRSYAAVAAAVIVTALLASYFPARRVLRADPAAALRSD